MIKRIDEYLRTLNKISIDNINYEYLYDKLILCENRVMNACNKDLFSIYTEISDRNKKYVKLNDSNIFVFNTEEFDKTKKCIELRVFFKLECISENIDKLITLLNKKRIKYNGKIELYDNVIYLCIVIDSIDYTSDVIDYINYKLGKCVYEANPLFFSVLNVMVSFEQRYSYLEILSMYLTKFLLDMKKKKMDINYDNFKNFMLDNYLKIDSQIDLHIYLEFNKKNIKLSEFFSNLDIMTNMILYLFNGNDYEDFKNYYRILNRKNNKLVSKYLTYDKIDDCYDLFIELVNSMYLNYGETYTRDNIIKYKNTGKYDYITRKNNLRKKVMASKTFMIYLGTISLEDELSKIIDQIKFEKEKNILEKVCRETYLSCWDGNKNYGKIQVARGLIRMSYGDYSAITRNNDARKIAIENIKSMNVDELIKSSLRIDNVRKEEELYELYAEYIENLCVN